MIRKLFKAIWKVIDVIFYVAACISLTCGVFLINRSAGLIALGAVLLITAFLTELVPSKGSDS